MTVLGDSDWGEEKQSVGNPEPLHVSLHQVDMHYCWVVNDLHDAFSMDPGPAVEGLSKTKPENAAKNS